MTTADIAATPAPSASGRRPVVRPPAPPRTATDLQAQGSSLKTLETLETEALRRALLTLAARCNLASQDPSQSRLHMAAAVLELLPLVRTAPVLAAVVRLLDAEGRLVAPDATLLATAAQARAGQAQAEAEAGQAVASLATFATLATLSTLTTDVRNPDAVRGELRRLREDITHLCRRCADA